MVTQDRQDVQFATARLIAHYDASTALIPSEPTCTIIPFQQVLAIAGASSAGGLRVRAPGVVALQAMPILCCCLEQSLECLPVRLCDGPSCHMHRCAVHAHFSFAHGSGCQCICVGCLLCCPMHMCLLLVWGAAAAAG
jgi:hypothetical protein